MLEFSDKQKKAILNGAWNTRAKSVGMDAFDFSKEADFPTLWVGVWSAAGKENELRDIFMQTLVEELGDDEPFMVSICPVLTSNKCDVQLVKDGRWVYSE